MEKKPARVSRLTKRFVSYLHTKNCNVNIIKHMILLGANVKYRDSNRNSLIHIALQHCDDKFNLIHELLVAGAKSNASNLLEKSALHYAVMYSDDIEVLRELVEHGADVHLEDSEDNSPLHLAVQNNKKSFVEALIQYGADVDLENSKDETPLIIAVKNGNLEIVKVLLSSRASASFVNYSVQTPLQVALDCPVPNQSILIELMKYGANMYSLNSHMLCPLDYAIKKYYAYPSDNLLSARTLLKCCALQHSQSMATLLQLNIIECLKIKYDVFPQLDAFYEECKLQRKRMESEFIHKNFCLLDFLREGFESNPMFKKKTTYRELVFNQVLNVSRNYPAYTDIIAYRLGKPDLCLKSMDLCMYTLKECSEGKRRIFLSPDAVFLIAGFLPNQDVLNLITAYSDPQNFATHDFGFQNLALGKSTKRKLDEKC
ncbi:unnamed protein product [Larinioides sclopetarius]|uniref:Alpha-latrotoxin n=1 Tax=Larinioides sclopetarius TaxID=280406 RepID=A0AAV2BV51_9ARAC